MLSVEAAGASFSLLAERKLLLGEDATVTPVARASIKYGTRCMMRAQ